MLPLLWDTPLCIMWYPRQPLGTMFLSCPMLR